jgi:predicted transcriptional regulator
LYSVWYEMDHFQSITEMKKNINSNVLDVYEIIQKGWATENHLIPEKQKVSISFDELQKRPVDTLAKVYSHFDLQMNNQNVVEYLETIKHYKKNDYSELSDEMVAEINERFEGVFERFGYAKINIEVPPN